MFHSQAFARVCLCVTKYTHIQGHMIRCRHTHSPPHAQRLIDSHPYLGCPSPTKSAFHGYPSAVRRLDTDSLLPTLCLHTRQVL